MKKVTKPKVRSLARGEKFNAKQMEAKAGDLLPRHRANIESVLIVMEGECIIELDGTNNTLKQGDSFIVPPEMEHQITAVKDFKAIHVMTNDIVFDYFD